MAARSFGFAQDDSCRVGIAHRFSEQISTILSGSARPTSLFLTDNCQLQTANLSSRQIADIN